MLTDTARTRAEAYADTLRFEDADGLPFAQDRKTCIENYLAGQCEAQQASAEEIEQLKERVQYWIRRAEEAEGRLFRLGY